MTSRIYYTDAYRRTFDATVTASDVVDGRLHVTLDQTALYPTSGGQPFDMGTLGGAAVTDVIDRDDGAIVPSSRSMTSVTAALPSVPVSNGCPPDVG